jgi:hypothetical protein
VVVVVVAAAAAVVVVGIYWLQLETNKNYLSYLSTEIVEILLLMV